VSLCGRDGLDITEQLDDFERLYGGSVRDAEQIGPSASAQPGVAFGDVDLS
jgi:hypothetical protein